MEPVIIIGIFVAFFGLVIFGIVMSIRAERKRTEALSALAGSLGFEFNAEGFAQGAATFGHLEFFNRGHSRRSKNMLSVNKDGNMVRLFDYRYTTGSGKNQSTHVSSVCTVEIQRELPGITARPEHFFDKIAAAIGWDDIDFEESPEFSKKFCVKSADKEFARKFFNKPMMDLLLRTGNVYLEAGGKALLIHFGKKLKVEDFPKLCATALEFVAAMPQ
ncbi:MAG: hypothetical protein RDV41_05140 [Planctomycetota bacterium]|nr:hypothetical protein [Planctomycetota bacterium]